MSATTKNDAVYRAAAGLVAAMHETVDQTMPADLAETVKFHSGSAAVAAAAAGWLPGVGAAALVTVSAGFLWTMYGRINATIGLPLSENIIKSVATGIATNLAAYAVGGLVMTAVFSFVPGLGSVGATAVAGATCYALTLASGVVYMKVLTELFLSGKDPSTMSADELRGRANTVINNNDMKSVINSAKNSYNKK